MIKSSFHHLNRILQIMEIQYLLGVEEMVDSTTGGFCSFDFVADHSGYKRIDFLALP